MRKIWRGCILWLVLGTFFCFGTALADRLVLEKNVIRLHVVAASDSESDQAVKLQVRDAVLNAVEDEIRKAPDALAAEAYLTTRLGDLETIANTVLAEAGSDDRAVVTLKKEEFPQRRYDTFSLPAGVYNSLRISIGEGRGRNWWCVVFPTLCMAASQKDLTDTAAGAGFSGGLTDTLEQKPGYEVRFFLLDCLGWIENWIHQ